MYTPYLYISHILVNTVDHVYGRRILRWHNLTSNYTLSPAAEATPVRLVGQPFEGVPDLPSPSIHSPPMTCLRFGLSIASLAGTLLDYDAGLLLTSEEDSEAAFENYWSPVSHSSVGSACSLVSLQVSFRRGITAHFLLLPSTVEGEFKTFACSLKCNELAYFFKAAGLAYAMDTGGGVASQNGVKK